MANLIDYTYFFDEFDLQIEKNPQNNLAPREVIDRYISRYQAECLKLFLGYDVTNSQNFYNLFISGMDDVERMINLKNQLVNAETKESPITGYVWYQFLKYHRGRLLENGTIRALNINGELLDDKEYICFSWNHMVDMWQDVFDWLKANQSTYPEFIEVENYFKMKNTLGI